MELIHLVFRILALSQVCFTCLYLLLHQRNRTGMMILAAGFCFLCYLASPLASAEFGIAGLSAPIAFFATCVPAVLWLLGNRFFNDDTAIPLPFILASASYLCLWYTGELGLVELPNRDIERALFELVPQLIKLGLVLHLVYVALAGKQHDLIARRLQMRVPLAAGGGAVAALVIVVELWAAGPAPMLIEAVGSVFMFILSLSVNLFLFRWRVDFPLILSPTAPKNAVQLAGAEEPANPDLQSLAEIERQMMELRFYARHGATLADFAEAIRLPAYRLRGLINTHMGFQNFNQFLNHYRIQEASRRLHSDPHLPILTIALDVGFKSMSSFNQAFKSVHKCTPSSFREQT